MTLVVVISRDDNRLATLRAALDEFAPKGTTVCQAFQTVDDAALFLRKNPPGLKCVLFSLVGGEAPEVYLRLSTSTKAAIIVELDGDDPELAYRLLGSGAFHVVASYGFRGKKLWEVISRTISRPSQPVPQPLLHGVQRPAERWGFMCMSYEVARHPHNDYEFAIRPAMKRLQLDLRRCDEIPSNEIDLLRQIEAAMKDRPVVVAQISSQTTWTHFEMGMAHTLNKTLLLLYRERSGKVPEFLNRYKYVAYSSMTELTLKLFFGLGGTKADLLPEDFLPSPATAQAP